MNLSLATDILGGTNSIVRFDKNIDGVWDIITGPHNHIQMRISDRMYDIVVDNGFWAKTTNGLYKIINDTNGNKILSRLVSDLGTSDRALTNDIMPKASQSGR